MEKQALKGQPATFMARYRYVSKAQHFSLDRISALPYDRNSDLYKKYTSEQLPQIHFSRQIKELADSITGGLTDPKEIVRKIYLWFKRDIPWTGALEYSIMPDIPAYVLQHRRGDCGMQTLLYMSMLRYKGIPVRWQSGWMVPAGYENLHDWCEIWFEGTGWVPSDVSYDLQASDDEQLKEFYMTGIDSYRMIVNSGITGSFYPEKRFPRSEPYDFQRGEVEWKGGNLYFSKWDYNMSLEYSE
jgi:transglutaminase-like putative cysteine protease